VWKDLSSIQLRPISCRSVEIGTICEGSGHRKILLRLYKSGIKLSYKTYYFSLFLSAHDFLPKRDKKSQYFCITFSVGKK